MPGIQRIKLNIDQNAQSITALRVGDVGSNHQLNATATDYPMRIQMTIKRIQAIDDCLHESLRLRLPVLRYALIASSIASQSAAC
ncbi:MAG: hypothetical protein H0V39_07095 [Nitrosomonas sp.]|nr:hypothetical protein [Nitrosomonas sp.]